MAGFPSRVQIYYTPSSLHLLLHIQIAFETVSAVDTGVHICSKFHFCLSSSTPRCGVTNQLMISLYRLCHHEHSCILAFSLTINIDGGPRGPAHLAKCLPYKPEELDLVPNTYIRSYVGLQAYIVVRAGGRGISGVSS